MIKKITYLFVLTQLFACNPKECFQPEGKMISKEMQVADFNEILVGNEISLIIKQGTEQQIIVETGENLIDNISVKVKDGELQLEDKNTCNFTRDYAITKVIVTAPNIKRIRSNTARLIKSEGVLNYPVLRLLSEDFQNNSLLNIGDFNLHINTENLIIYSNGNSVFHIKGNTNGLRVEFNAGSPRFEGSELLANKVYLLQKSTNDMLVNPQLWIKAYIYNIGDVISYNVPPEITVEEHYTGKLIFN